MSKTYIITFSISVLVLFTLAAIALMLFIPQQVQIVEGSINNYETIKKSEYTFEQTKDISDDALTRQYNISSEDMEKFVTSKQYKPGNADPFTSKENGNTGNSGNNGNTNPDDKTTNGNGGIANPPSTNK